MPITDLLERNSKLYGDEVALVEINPKLPGQSLTKKQIESLIFYYLAELKKVRKLRFY